jgi:hypothetical protein
MTSEGTAIEVERYKKNKNVLPREFSKLYRHFLNWKEMLPSVASVAYDYHFYRHQFLDVGGIRHAKVINGDIKFYFNEGIGGAIEDASQRCFFPTGYPFYVYARTLFDASLSWEEIAEEYFSIAFGKDWRSFYEYLERLGEAFDFEYLEGECIVDENYTNWYDPSRVERLMTVKDIVEDGRRLIEANYNSKYRIQTVSVRLLEYHTEYALLFADAMMAKALGDDLKADELFNKMRIETGKFEAFIERWYDHGLVYRSLIKIFESRKRCDEPDLF